MASVELLIPWIRCGAPQMYP